MSALQEVRSLTHVLFRHAHMKQPTRVMPTQTNPASIIRKSLVALKDLLRRKDQQADINMDAYKAGYAAGADGGKNPHRRGTVFHKSWEKGYEDRNSNELYYW